MALQYGFFNAVKQQDGSYDRKYNALDYSRNMGAFISTGVRRSQLNDFKPTFTNSNNNIKFNIGYAWIDGHWAYNDSDYQVDVEAQPVGDNNRRDIVVLRLNNNTANRDITFKYIKGAEIAGASYPAITSVIQRSGGIYDIALCSITFEKKGTSYTKTLTDLRADKEVCGWVTSPVGYDEYWENLDAAFMEWFNEKKNQLASVTMIKRYTQHLTVQSETNQVLFNIPQYDASGVDLIDVYVNGILASYEEDYTIEGNNLIKFTTNKIGGTEIDIYVYKSIDGTGLGSVSDEITELQNQMATVKNIGEYIYICNGVDDNVKLSDIAQAWWASNQDTDNKMLISVYGKFGCKAPYGGNGTGTSRYRWLSLGSTARNIRAKLIVDFAGVTNTIQVGTIGDGTSNDKTEYIFFYGYNIVIRNINLKMTTSCYSFEVFSHYKNDLLVENSKFDLKGYATIAGGGTFNNCYGRVMNDNGNVKYSDAHLFIVSEILRLNGGEYLAYLDSNSVDAGGYSIILCKNLGICICNDVSAPSIEESGYTQGYFFYMTPTTSNVVGRFTNCITLLSFTKGTTETQDIIVTNKIPRSVQTMLF